jgi:hypothetical protein
MMVIAVTYCTYLTMGALESGATAAKMANQGPWGRGAAKPKFVPRPSRCRRPFRDATAEPQGLR